MNAAVLGEEYQAQKDTLRERNAKELTALSGEDAKAVPFAGITDGKGFETHSLIQPKASPFVRQSTGTQIEVPETVHTHEIIISAVEAAKRIKAELGEVPEGFINAMREQYPEGVSTRIVDELIKTNKPKAEPSFKEWIIEGGAAAPAGDFEQTAEKKTKIA